MGIGEMLTASSVIISANGRKAEFTANPHGFGLLCLEHVHQHPPLGLRKLEAH